MNLIIRKSPKLAKIWSEGRPLKRQVTFQQGGWSLRNASQSHRGPPRAQRAHPLFKVHNRQQGVSNWL